GRGDDGRLFRLRPRPRADHLDGRGARARPVLGRAHDRELPHLRHPARRMNRFEILPFPRGEKEAAQLPEPAHLTVTTSPKPGLDHTVEVAARLRGLGHTITVHFTCRMVRSADHLDELLGKTAEAGIDDLFVVGGDATPPEGPYASAVELLPLIAEH